MLQQSRGGKFVNTKKNLYTVKITEMNDFFQGDESRH